MSIAPSLHNRLKKLEAVASIGPQSNPADVMRKSREERLAREKTMTHEELEAYRRQSEDAAIAFYLADPIEKGTRDAVWPDLRRRIGKRLLAARLAAETNPSPDSLPSLTIEQDRS